MTKKIRAPWPHTDVIDKHYLVMQEAIASARIIGGQDDGDISIMEPHLRNTDPKLSIASPISAVTVVRVSCAGLVQRYVQHVSLSKHADGVLYWIVRCWLRDNSRQRLVSKRMCPVDDVGTLVGLILGAHIQG